MQNPLKLILMKTAINAVTLVATRLLPQPRATYPQTRILDRVFQRLMHVFATERRAQRRGLEDHNFQRLLDVASRALAFISEEDRYYRMWLGLLFLLVEEEVARARDTMTREDALRWIEAQFHLKGYTVISERMYQQLKPEIFPVVFTDFLHNLA